MAKIMIYYLSHNVYTRVDLEIQKLEKYEVISNPAGLERQQRFPPSQSSTKVSERS